MNFNFVGIFYWLGGIIYTHLAGLHHKYIIQYSFLWMWINSDAIWHLNLALVAFAKCDVVISRFHDFIVYNRDDTDNNQLKVKLKFCAFGGFAYLLGSRMIISIDNGLNWNNNVLKALIQNTLQSQSPMGRRFNLTETIWDTACQLIELSNDRESLWNWLRFYSPDRSPVSDIFQIWPVTGSKVSQSCKIQHLNNKNKCLYVM